MNRFVDDLKDLGSAERRASMEGRIMAGIINPPPGVCLFPLFSFVCVCVCVCVCACVSVCVYQHYIYISTLHIHIRTKDQRSLQPTKGQGCVHFYHPKP